MVPILENCILDTDLDAKCYSLLNVNEIIPIPDNLVPSDDPRLSDARAPITASVTDSSVAPDAAIAQSKLNLNGTIPTSWLGTTTTTAAQGDLAEYKAFKGVNGGYASLDGGGHIPLAQVPSSVGTGTITNVDLVMPSQFTVVGGPITTSGTFTVTWNTQAAFSWLGNNTGGTTFPVFNTSAFPTSLIPSLDAAIVTSGTFAAARLPIAVGLGVSHAIGAVPDPGDGTGGALATDYLARDMSYKPVPDLGPSYQPVISDPVLTESTNVTGARTVVAQAGTGAETGLTFFYSFTSGSADFLEYPSTGFVSVDPAAEVWVYAAAAGYTNSNVVNYTNPNP